MTEKKSMVIKVKYPTPGKATSKPVSAKGVITEWNFKRIALALGGLLVIAMSFFYITDDSDDKKNASTAALAEPEQHVVEINSPPDKELVSTGQTTAADHPAANDKPYTVNAKSVVRSQITSEIKNNEPIDNIPLPIKIGKKETLWLYYFAELKGMKGQAVYHEWWLNGDLVSRKKVNISDNIWRTSSKQIITYTTNNDWIVRLVDESRNKLSEKSFNLQLK
jgi:hypothetical protein